MKKLISTILLSTFLLTACSSNTTSSNDNVLRVGMDLKFPPFSYLSDDGEAVGLEPQISKAFAEYLGMEVEIVNTDFSMLIPALDLGELDILIADMSKTDERAEKVDFSDPYRYTHTLALVNSDFANENNITNDMSAEDFFAIEDANFVGLSGTKGVYFPESFGVSVTEVTSIGTALVEVSNGLADVLVASNEIHGFHSADPENTIVFSNLNHRNTSNFAVKKGNTELLEKANEFIETMYEDGGFYDLIRDEFDPIVGEFLQNDELGLDYITNPIG